MLAIHIHSKNQINDVENIEKKQNKIKSWPVSGVWSGRFGTITSDTSGRRSFSISSISRWSLVSFLDTLHVIGRENYEPIEPMYKYVQWPWRPSQLDGAVVRRRSFTHGRLSYVQYGTTYTYYIIAVCSSSCSMFFYFFVFCQPYFLCLFYLLASRAMYYRSNHVTNCSVSFGCPWVCQLGRDVPSYSILMLFPPYPQRNWNGIDGSSCVVHHATIIRKLPIVYQSLTSCSLVRVTQWMRVRSPSFV